MPYPDPNEEKRETPPEESEVPPEQEEETKDPVEKEQMNIVAEKLAEMTSILKEIKSSLMSADTVRKEKQGAVVTEIACPTVDKTDSESAKVSGISQKGSPPTKRSEETMVKEVENRVLANVRKELRLGSVGAVRPEGDNTPLENAPSVRSFVKEALNGKKMSLNDIREVIW